MKAFIISEIIWSAYTAAVIFLTHSLLLPFMFYFSGWAIYGLATLFVKGLDRYHKNLLKKLAERGLMPGDSIEAVLTPAERITDPERARNLGLNIEVKYLEGCGNCDC